ncbi:TPA: fimbrial protein [Citrobacter freundii]
MKIKNRQRNDIHAGKVLFFLTAIAFYFLAAPGYALGSATCTANGSMVVINATGGTVTFPPNIAIGSPASSGSFASSSISSLVTCKYKSDTSANRELDYMIGSNNSIAGTYQDRTTFNTNLEGFGVQLGGSLNLHSNVSADSQTVLGDWITGGDKSIEGRSTISSSNETVTIDVTAQVYFVKTAGDVANGTASGQVGYVKIMPDRVPANLITVPIVLAGVKVAASGCDVSSTKELNIVLDDVQKSDLPEVNSTWGQSSAQNIQLACSTGTSVGITFSGTKSSDSAADASVLQNNGSAQGIGVQLLKSDGTPYVLGTRVAVSSSSDNTVNIPVSARYIRTGDMVAGSVTSSATYTLDYE